MRNLFRSGSEALTLCVTFCSALYGADRIDLNGQWRMSIHGDFVKAITVPSTFLPMGGATLERTFAVPAREPGRALLHFEAVVMSAHVRLNGTPIGDFGPYTPFTIDVTNQLRTGENQLAVDIDDIDGIPHMGDGFPAIRRHSERCVARVPACYLH